MATARNRRSKELDFEMSNELGKLKHDIKSFKDLFEGEKTSLQGITNYFEQEADSIKRMQDKTARSRNVGVGIGAVGTILLLFTGGLSAVCMLTIGGTTIISSNITKMLLENKGKEKIQNSAEDFNRSIQPIVECLKKIQTVVKTLEVLSSSTSMVATGLSTAAEVTSLLKKVAELIKNTELDAVRLEFILHDLIRLLGIILGIIEVRRDEALEKEFIDNIMESAKLCRKTIDVFETLTGEFNKVSDFLQHF